jgi:xanthine dehydrogenase accessory factor
MSKDSKRVLIRGAGDLASGIAYELWLEGHKVLMTDIAVPLAVRRAVSFSRAVYEGEAQVEAAKGVLVHNLEEARCVTEKGDIPVIVDEKAVIRWEYQPDVLVDAVMAKRNTGTSMTDAPLVVGIGPGFTAGADCHCVIETKRGPDLGRIIRDGSAAFNTGIPGEVGGYTAERLLRAACDGRMEPLAGIGDHVEKGQIAAYTGGEPVYAEMSGIVRGMLMWDVMVTKGLKIGDIDAREIVSSCYQISDKARCIGRSVCNAIT